MYTIILPQASLIQKLLRPVKPVAGTVLRPISYLVQEQVPEGFLWFNVMTKELILLENEDWMGNEELTKFLSDHLFLVPQDYDEYQTWLQLRAFIKMHQYQKWDKKLSSYTILTTTDCNARCFYCYEKGCVTQTMTEKTALDVADYILNTGSLKAVTLNWFGGEPLYNSAAIDTICKKLNQEERTFTSTMISNGYLFNEELIRKAVEEWKLKKVQITLDGTEEVYNKRKAYVYKGVNAYQRVLQNIGLLLEAGIHVAIRLNMDAVNLSDLKMLVSELQERLGGKSGLTVYSHLIFQQEAKVNEGLATDLGTQWLEFEGTLEQLGLRKPGGLNRNLKLNHCTADNDSGILIMPDGNLQLCEHINSEESSHVGSIYTEERNVEVKNKWKQLYIDESCRGCAYFPDCSMLKCCPNLGNGCFAFKRLYYIRNCASAMRRVWKKFRNKQPQE